MMKKIVICIGISVLLFIPAYTVAILGTSILASFTGLLIPSYVICCLAGGFLDSLPFIVVIGSSTLPKTYKFILIPLIIILLAGLIFLAAQL